MAVRNKICVVKYREDSFYILATDDSFIGGLAYGNFDMLTEKVIELAKERPSLFLESPHLGQYISQDQKQRILQIREGVVELIAKEIDKRKLPIEDLLAKLK